MAGRLTRVLRRITSLLQEWTPGLSPAAAPLRSADGTYGTQRAHSRQVADVRRERYPSD